MFALSVGPACTACLGRTGAHAAAAARRAMVLPLYSGGWTARGDLPRPTRVLFIVLGAKIPSRAPSLVSLPAPLSPQGVPTGSPAALMFFRV